MFLKRLMTGLILSFATILAISLFSLPIYITIVTAFMLVVTLEWGVLMNIRSLFNRLVYVFIMGFFMFLSTYLPMMVILWVAFIFWILVSLLILSYPRGSAIWGNGFWLRGIMGFLAIIPAWLALNQLRASIDGIMLTIFMLFLIWSVDTGGYSFGKYFGKYKLLPNVSPNKTIEGLYGAFILPLIVASIGCFIIKTSFSHWLLMLVLTFLVSIFAIIGDLLESMLKRQVGLKDLGTYLPGHGGLLDRVDSLLAAAPIFLLGLMILKI